MWGLFIVVLLAGSTLTLLPGVALLKASGFSWQESIMLAYPVSAVIFTVVGIGNNYLDIDGLLWLIGVSFTLTTFLCSIILLTKKHSQKQKVLQNSKPQNKRSHQKNKTTWKEIALYICINSTIVITIFFAPLSDPTIALTFGDNDYHLTVIKSMMDSGNYSTLNVSCYPDNLPSTEIPLINPSGYYPAAYHVLSNLMTVIPGATAALAENASNFLISAIVFSLSVLFFLREVFPSNKYIVYAGAFTTCACVAFPLRAMVVHQIYPSIAAFSCIPCVAALFYVFTLPHQNRMTRTRSLIFCIVTLCGIALLHPSGLFAWAVYALAIIVASYLPRVISKTRYSRNRKLAQLVVGTIIAVTIFAAIWLYLLDHPAFQNTTNYLWKWTVSPLIGLATTLTLGFRLLSPDYVLCLMMIIGFIYCIKKKRIRWLCIATVLFFTIFYFNATGSPEIKRLVAGFWYTDPERTSALAAIAAIPLTTVGLYCVARFIIKQTIVIAFRFKKSYVKQSHQMQSPRNRKLAYSAGAITLLIFMFLNYIPHFLGIPIRGIAEKPAFSNTRSLTIEWADTDEDLIYDQAERDFVEKALNIVGTDDPILNMPYDGSLYAYAFNNANVYYKSHIDEKDSVNSQLIRLQLDDVASNKSIAEAVKDTGAKYVLKLHQDPESNNDRNHWNPEAWTGLDSVTDETPGFEVVLSEGDMRLYRITN